jgi:hypothetical protein
VTLGPNPEGGARTVITFPYERPAGPAPTEADRALSPAPVKAAP